MTQLIINGHRYPQTSHDKYRAYKRELGESMRMASSRRVTEIQAEVWVIDYSYDRLPDGLMRQCLSDLSGSGLQVSFLSPEGDVLVDGIFDCTARPSPTFAYSRGGAPMWHNISFTLEQVEGV